MHVLGGDRHNSYPILLVEISGNKLRVKNKIRFTCIKALVCSRYWAKSTHSLIVIYLFSKKGLGLIFQMTKLRLREVK